MSPPQTRLVRRDLGTGRRTRPCAATTRPQQDGRPFRSPDGGPLGQVVEGRVRLLQRPTRPTSLPALPPRSAPTDEVTVVVVPMMLGDDGLTLRAVADRVDGLVVAALGAGHVPQAVVGADRAGRTRASGAGLRTGSGPVLTSTYGFPGSESDLLGRGLIPAGCLDPFKARILLHHLLASGHSIEAVRAAFADR